MILPPLPVRASLLTAGQFNIYEIMKFKGNNIKISKKASLGKNVRIGDNVVIYDNVIIGDDVIICNDCVIGEPLNDYYFNDHYLQPSTVIGKKSLIRSHTIIYAGTVIGDHFQTGHRVTIRERTLIGNYCSIGSYNDIQGDCEIGDYCRFHSYVNIGKKTIVGSFVFIYPFVVVTNDPTPPSDDLKSTQIGDYTQVCAGCVLLPGAKIGANCLIGANSTVGGTYEDDSFINGSPAKRIGKLSIMPFYNGKGKRHYPWPYNFDRGMPWAKMGFEKWKETQDR